MASDITYTSLGGNQYLITLTIYRDCSGIALDTLPQNINIISSCQNFTARVDFVSKTNVSQICASQNTSCNGGTLPGTEQYVFRGIATLQPCSDWVLSWNLCCRNDAITNLSNPSSQNLFVKTTLDNSLITNNNSPQFNGLPTPYLCANQLTVYNHGVYDIDGDSLYYEFTTPLGGSSSPGTPLIFSAGYTQNNPLLTLSGMNLNSSTGEMCFTPSSAQIAVVAVLIKEYRNGVLIGTQIREMQVIVEGSCINSAPFAGTAPNCGNTGGLQITTAGPSVIQTGSNSITMCPLDSICFEVNFSDPDGNNINVTSNVISSIPGASFSVIDNGTINPIGLFCWVPTPLDSGLNVFTINLRDDACPISASQYYTYAINILTKPFAGNDITICGNQWAELNAVGGTNYNWSVLTGDTLQLGANITCNPCSNPSVKPTTTTTYLLTSTSLSCINTDTVTVFVVPDFSINPIGDTLLCDFVSTQIGVNFTPNDSYSVSWDNTNTLSSDTSLFPIASPMATTTYILTATSSVGCIKSDSVIVSVNPPPTFNLIPGNTTICLGDSVSFNVQSQCNYTLEMFDTYGDGWNGQAIQVYLNGTLSGTYTLSGSTSGSDGSYGVISFPVNSGSNIELKYVTGSFQGESSFNLINPSGVTEYSVAAGGMLGWTTGFTIYTGIIECGNSISNFSSYFWDNSSSLTDTSIFNPIAFPSDTTQYTFTLVDSVGCKVVRTQTINIVPNFTISSNQSNVTICQGDSITLYATPSVSGLYNYYWFPASLFANSDSIQTIPLNNFGLNALSVAVNNFGCTKVDSFFVNVIPPVITNFSPIQICQGESVSIFGLPRNVAGIYKDTLLSSVGCDSILVQELIINPKFSTPLNQSICQGDSLFLGGSYQYIAGTYYDTLQSIKGCDSVLITSLMVNLKYSINRNDSICYGDSILLANNYQTTVGTYIDNLTTISGCDSLVTTNLFIKPRPIVTINANPTTIISGQSSQLNATGGENYLWSPSENLSCNTCQNSIASPLQTTLYQVDVTTNGCTSSDTVSIFVSSELIIPEVFSPNGDGINDFFEIRGLEQYPENSLIILNRWGNKVFESSPYKSDWDGSNSIGISLGSKLPTGTYYYILKLANPRTLLQEELKGYIYINR